VPDAHLTVTGIQDAVERLYDLNVGVIGSGAERHERPHKPLLLLTVLDLIGSGQASSERIQWSKELQIRFTEYFARVRSRNGNDTPENPFLYLRGDGIWQPVAAAGTGSVFPLERPPTAADAKAKRVYARFINGFEKCVQEAASRLRLREAIISRYFPHNRAELESLFVDAMRAEDSSNRVKEEPEASVGRSPAFRRKVLEVYDWQCAACGLRIKLPDADLTFIDGAHLIPFYLSHNDHPSNGIALCKNHHWAMDRFLIVPTPEGIWKASPRLDSRRSPGEKGLREIDSQPILPPHDEAFRPSADALRWRAERIYAG
jgi:putative restriction endonuclease